ncbi:hypothetical protein DRP77_12465 [Candidatus Poribacteria bacterium]|nr:MAG: hypothetical protein DRP77_12465 [Candidatus Poribacteria bacterium]
MGDISGKPYDFVFIDPSLLREGPSLRGVAGHHLFSADRLSGEIRFKLKALTPLHIGGGMIEVREVGGRERAISTHASFKSIPVIPGSSIKGAVRVIVEAVSPSCMRALGSKSRRHLPKAIKGGCSMDKGRLCPACRLFGAPGWLGAAWFEDIPFPRESLTTVKTPPLWTPGRGGGKQLPAVYLSEDDRCAKGWKMYFHMRPAEGEELRAAIKAGAEAAGRVAFENLSEGELGLLIMGMGYRRERSFPIKIGGAKPAGLGSVRISIERIRLLDPEGLRKTGRAGWRELSGEELAGRIAGWIDAAFKEGLILEEQLKDLDWMLDDRGFQLQAPSGTY